MEKLVRWCVGALVGPTRIVRCGAGRARLRFCVTQCRLSCLFQSWDANQANQADQANQANQNRFQTSSPLAMISGTECVKRSQTTGSTPSEMMVPNCWHRSGIAQMNARTNVTR